MKNVTRLSLLLVIVLALLFSSLSPARAVRADHDLPPPPADSTADTFTLRRIWDINLGGPSSYPVDMVVYGGVLYIVAETAATGRELWKFSDLNVIDIYPGATGSSPQYLTVYAGEIFFSALGPDGAGTELWKYDTVNGAQRAADIVPGANGSFPTHLAVYNNILYFSANGNDGAGYELWQYDTVNGAQRVEDISPGLGDSNPQYMTVFDGDLYFKADGGDGTGHELWKYDTANGAQRVVDILPGVGASSPEYLTVHNGVLFFGADAGNGLGRELYQYDPLNGVQLAAEINAGEPSSNPASLAVYHRALYLQANGYDAAGPELWRYDPLNGADRVADIKPGPIGSGPVGMIIFDTALYFGADGGDGFGFELWKYNNTATLLIQPTRSYEGWVLEASENSSLGGILNNNAVAFNLGDDAQDRQYRSILSFNTASLPDNAVILSAKVKIRRQGLVGTNPFTTHGNILIDIIKGAFSGSNALQTGDFQAAPSRAGAGTIKNFPDVNDWFTGKLGKTAFPYLNKTGITQLRLRFTKDDNDDNGADFLTFYSADTASIADFPVLEVKYYIP